jgi:hypothetical protein
MKNTNNPPEERPRRKGQCQRQRTQTTTRSVNRTLGFQDDAFKKVTSPKRYHHLVQTDQRFSSGAWEQTQTLESSTTPVAANMAPKGVTVVSTSNVGQYFHLDTSHCPTKSHRYQERRLKQARHQDLKSSRTRPYHADAGDLTALTVKETVQHLA